MIKNMAQLSGKLHLGCGTNTPDGWINLDGSWNAWLVQYPRIRNLMRAINLLPAHANKVNWGSGIVIHDVRKPLPFPDCSMEAIYASHLLEHLYLNEACKLLSECHRIIKPGGVLRIVVPDLKFIVEDYYSARPEHKNTGKHAPECAADTLNKKLLMRDQNSPSGNIFYRIYTVFKDFHSHKWSYDAESLIWYFEQAGFKDVYEMMVYKSRIMQIEHIEKAERILGGAGICVEGIKNIIDSEK
jgi:predicted SAM-dependent methyltransferase